ncbi:uncharacterized protein LOC113289838 isoform X3 [Papaver somniferum]|uniref:uncharacterized protein LOC113289838 isoform X3 n=1 Tax=Papaver somniferum TaxID=3469 RepID=UPI000E70284A|nr:uncharacterized protein LOC113289838 isoform X3 [Papaver somniferum]XP_026395037.1 uncharacterized protein LOC113289838 isoform X3 [Papaver somniferum]XP_026395038.1 uncharacterized protein LOC113289838 isoform X3 [Papaver somniferum]XP_026395039.1 uncharacterized protein LOC113289838 isoform X3 [Papaver somniferum]
MRISIFSATDSDAGAYSSYNNQDQPASSLRPSSTLTGDGASTSGVKKRFRSTPNLVITYAPHSPAADLNDNIVTTQADDTASVEDDNSTSSMVNVWDIASAKAYDAQNHTDAWQQTRYPNYWFDPSLGLSGGISLAWKNGVDIEIMHTTSDSIHAIVHAHDNNVDFLITFMYGAHEAIENSNQWQYLIDMHSYFDLPWILWGDLNFNMHDSETHSSRVTHPHHARHVRNYVQQLGLIDLGYSGADITWSNHRSGDEHVSARLDRDLVNSQWINHYTTARLQHLIPIASDHCPILLHTVPTDSKSSPFKLYKCWFQLDSCTDAISRSWHQQYSGSPSFQFSSKLKLTRTQLQLWKRMSFGNIESNLQNIQNHIQRCYDNNLPSSHPQVKRLSSSLQQWLSIQKEFFMQKAGSFGNSV